MNDNEIYAFLVGLIVGTTGATIMVVILLNGMENRIERSCLLDQEVGLNDIMYDCAVQK